MQIRWIRTENCTLHLFTFSSVYIFVWIICYGFCQVLIKKIPFPFSPVSTSCAKMLLLIITSTMASFLCLVGWWTVLNLKNSDVKLKCQQKLCGVQKWTLYPHYSGQVCCWLDKPGILGAGTHTPDYALSRGAHFIILQVIWGIWKVWHFFLDVNTHWSFPLSTG